MKKLITLFSTVGLVMLSIASMAQSQKNATINGTVKGNDKPVDAANVSLLKAKDSSIVKMSITDKSGNYEFLIVANGKYLVQVVAIGYAKYTTDVIELTADKNTITLKPISLQIISKELGNVMVASKKQFIEQKLDKTIINVDASPTNAGLSVLEILEKAPGVIVDKDGNISLKGKQGVNILVDGRPTYLSGQDLANMLKNMPSGNLDQLEIMINPPAKYDASGNAGVINIKTKKTKTPGFNGSVSSGYTQGVYPKSNNSFNLNYKKGKYNFFANAAYNYREGFQDLILFRNFTDKNSGQLLSTFDQKTRGKRQYRSGNAKLGMDYFANKKTTFGIVVNGNMENGNEYTDNTTLIKDKNGLLTTRTLANNDIKLDFKNVGVNLNFKHVFDSTGKEITADVDYLNYTSGNSQYMNNYFFDASDNKQNPDELLKGDLPSIINIYSAKVDYVQTLKNKVKFEAGLKTSYVETDNNALYENFNGNSWIKDVARSNHFKYTENVNAVYTNFSKEFTKKWSGQLGFRVENTIAKGKQITTAQNFDRNYTQVFPTAYIGYNHNEKNQFSLSYGRRIERPDYQDMNPFFYFLDKYTYQVGNPYLTPQFAHNIELGHTFGGFLTTSISYSNTKDIIQDVLDQIDSINTTFVRKDNIAKQQNLGLTVSAAIPVAKWWKTNIYTNVYNNKFNGLVNGANLEISATTFVTNISNQFSFNKGWSAELSGFFRSEGLEGVFVVKPLGAVNFGISKQILKNKGSIRFNVRDLFYTQPARISSKYQNIDINFSERRDTRTANITFTYRFGKGKAVQQRRRGGVGDEQNRVKGGNSN